MHEALRPLHNMSSCVVHKHKDSFTFHLLISSESFKKITEIQIMLIFYLTFDEILKLETYFELM
jgi:hypothetical protein